MRLKITYLLVFVSIVGLFSQCSERIEPKPVTYSQLLTGTDKKAWRLVSYQIIDEGVASPVVSAQTGFPPCVADDQYVFYANDERRFEVTEGATKCDPSDPDIFVTDTWALVNANATLQFLFPLLAGESYPFTIKNLTDRVLTIEYYFPDIDASYRFTFNAVTTK